jgi:hypothetical protein
VEEGLAKPKTRSMLYHNVDIAMRTSAKSVGNRNKRAHNPLPTLISTDGMIRILCKGFKSGFLDRYEGELSCAVYASHMHVRMEVDRAVGVTENPFLQSIYQRYVMDIDESKDVSFIFSHLPPTYGTIVPHLQSMMAAWEMRDNINETRATITLQRRVKMWLYHPNSPFVNKQISEMTTIHMSG